MRFLFGDFETFFSRTYTLKKLTTEEYIRSPEFEALTFCGYYPDTGESFKIVGHEQIKQFISQIKWSEIYFVSHHCQFDALILSHHFGAYPAMLGCTLSMARTQSRERVGDRLSLEALADRIGGYAKTVNYNAFIGKRGHQLSKGELEALADQCLDDCMITYDLWDYFIRDCKFPPNELIVIDITIKMFSDPQLIGDPELFDSLAIEEIRRKQALLDKVGCTRADLLSTNHCKELLESFGERVAMKEGKNGLIPALAKSDNYLQDLLTSENEIVAAIAEARVNVKSTIVETRAQRFAAIARRGAFPIYLSYCAAHTTRWGGGDKSNPQNLTRKGKLRKGLSAPDGKKLIVVDYAQIEARTLLTLAKQYDQLEYFIQGRDLYVAMASRLYGVPPEAITADQRGMGKQLVLACGYGAGARTIQRTAKSGQYTNGVPLLISLDQAETAKIVYREANPNVVRLWYWADDVLKFMLSDHPNKRLPDDFFLPIQILDKRVWLPNGLSLDYSSLSIVPIELGEDARPRNFILNKGNDQLFFREMTIKHRHEIKNIYGGKFIENIVQALARVILSDAMVRIRHHPVLRHLKMVMTTHDELVFVCPDELVDEAVKLLQDEMTRPVKWLKDVPLAVEIKTGDQYGK